DAFRSRRPQRGAVSAVAPPALSVRPAPGSTIKPSCRRNADPPQYGGTMAFDFKLKDPSLVRQQCHIDGQWVDADNGKHIEVPDPASGEVVGRVPRAGAAETQRAIDAAERALPAWRARTAADRARVLRRWYELLMQNQEDLARLMTLEQG